MVPAPGPSAAKRRKRRLAAVEIRRAGKGMQQDKITQRTHTTTASPPACLSSEDLERRRCAVKEPQQGKPSPRVTGGRTGCIQVNNNNREKNGHQDTALPLQPGPPSSKGRGSDFMTLVRFLCEETSLTFVQEPSLIIVQGTSLTFMQEHSLIIVQATSQTSSPISVPWRRAR